MKKIFIKHIISIFITVVFCLASVLVFVFLISNIKSKTNKVLALKERLVSYQINKKSFNEEVYKIKGLEDRINVIQQNIIKEELVPELLSNLESLAQQKNTSFEITSVQNIKNEDLRKIVLEAKITSTYQGLITFLGLLEHQSFLTNIKNIYLFTDQITINDSEELTTQALGEKSKQVQKEPNWQAVVTIEILSVE